MKKLIFILTVAALSVACSSDDGTPTNNNPDGPISSEQIIDWVSGDATEIGLTLITDRLQSTGNNSFTGYEFQIKITPKPGYENIPYRVYAREYTLHSDGPEYYSQDAIGNFIGDIVGFPNTYNMTFHVYMSDYMEYDAEILFKGENPTGGQSEWSAQGHERQ